MDLLLDSFHRIGPWAFSALLIAAAWCDARAYLIPDRYSVLIALLYLAYALTGPEPSSVAGALVVAAGVLVVTAGLFAANLMGGGDVKLMATTALWAGTTNLMPFLFVTALAGGALSLFALLRIRVAAIAGRGAAVHQRAVPYGLAIAAGGLYVASRLIGF